MARTEKFTAAQVINAIEGSGGIKTAIANRLKCSRWTVDNYIERHPTVKRAYEAERAAIVDLSETQFFKKIKDGFWPAIRLCLLTLGKDRGYVQKQEIGGKVEVETPGLVEVLYSQRGEKAPTED